MVVANQTLTANLGAKVKRVSHNGRNYLVAPASLIVPGVLNGSDGALYYPPEEVSRNVSSWDGVPLVVYHPLTENGQPTSALTPEGKTDKAVYQRVGVGALRNTRYDGNRLVAEAWFDEEHTRNHDVNLFGPSKILPRLNAEQAIELSTGLHVERDVRNGSCPKTGRPYDAVARNYRPDHLAVLPDQRGACSVADGCGVVVNTEESEGTWVTLPGGVHLFIDKDGDVVKGPKALLSEKKAKKDDDPGGHKKAADTHREKAKKAEESGDAGQAKAHHSMSKHHDLRARGVMNEETTENAGKYGNPQCGDTGKFMLHGSGTGKGETHAAAKEGRHGLKTTENDCAGGIAENCSQTSKVMNSNSGDSTMALKIEERTSLLTKLVMNCKCSEVDAKVLNTLSDDALVRVSNAFPMAKQEKDPEEDEDKKEEEDMDKKKVPPAFAKNQRQKEPVVNAEIKTPTFEELLNAAPPAYRAVWNTAVKVEHRERKELLTKLVANVTADKKEATWNAFKDKPIDELQSIVDLIPAKQPVQNANPLPFPSYPTFQGAGGYSEGVTNNQQGEQDLLDIPTINWNEQVSA